MFWVLFLRGNFHLPDPGLFVVFINGASASGTLAHFILQAWVKICAYFHPIHYWVLPVPDGTGSHFASALARCSLHLYINSLPSLLPIKCFQFRSDAPHMDRRHQLLVCLNTLFLTTVRFASRNVQLPPPSDPPQFAGLLWFYIMQQWLSCTDRSDCMWSVCCRLLE